MLAEFLVLLGTFDVGDFIPSLNWVSGLNGFNVRVKKCFEEFDTFFERDMFAAGTDTVHTVIDWAMAELIKHPSMMMKARDEVDRTIGTESMIKEDDTEKMSYLKMIIKEVLRLHPPLPLLVPRESTEEIELFGYSLPTKMRVFVNAWAIGRDTESWKDPEEFYPERFANTAVDFEGKDFELIPFGAGRRGCPGIHFATPTIYLAIASLLHLFDWELPGENTTL
ncbi:Cytochrome P450 71A1 [Acorus calamus]|uniref:Cytochrome P450 71A1 n=1 Tax=Acorus calamus TaxID=4465 RepID=A0AAV9CX16_ACOCL|nr:Cytochrome P450 71A1 [Acorus calamus]